MGSRIPIADEVIFAQADQNAAAFYDPAGSPGIATKNS
jgi:hypothetical protein